MSEYQIVLGQRIGAGATDNVKDPCRIGWDYPNLTHSMILYCILAATVVPTVVGHVAASISASTLYLHSCQLHEYSAMSVQLLSKSSCDGNQQDPDQSRKINQVWETLYGKPQGDVKCRPFEVQVQVEQSSKTSH